MKKNLSFFVLFLLTIFSPSLILGDVIELDNGSKIIGIIEKIGDGKVHIKTDFAGTLKIDMEHVTNLTSDDPLFVAFENGNRIYGKINSNKEQTQIDMPDGNSFVTEEAIIAVWFKDQLDPLAPPTRKWSFGIGVNIAGKTGNSEKFSTGGRMTAKLQGPLDRLSFFLRWDYSREDGDKSDDLITGGIDYETDFAERHSWYARTELERDDIKDLDLRSTAALGYGYYFIKKTDHRLRGRTGIMFRHESYDNGDSESTLGPDLGIYHMYGWDEWWKLITDVTFTPSFEDIHDYRVYHESAFEIPLADSENWKLQLGIDNDYDSTPAEGKKRLDTTYFSRLVYQWD